MPALHGLVSSLEKCTMQLPVLQHLLTTIRNLYVAADTTRRALMLRAIRFCMNSATCVKLLTADELHWLVVESLERDSEYAVERIQALKLVDKVRKVDADHFPVAFGRSLIAIANSKDDTFRKICMESLRELAVANAPLVASLHGFATLMDAVLEPITAELADNITMTVLFLLNDPNTRRTVESCVDLRMLLAPFTDLDTDPAELTPKWNAAKAAFNLLMKSWVGIVHLVSDDNALGMLVGMLKDPKIPHHTQDIILDAISGVFGNICFKVTYKSRRHRHEFGGQGQHHASSPVPSPLGGGDGQFRQNRAISDTDMFRDTVSSPTGSSSTTGGNHRGRSSFTSLFGSAPSKEAAAADAAVLSSGSATFHASNAAAAGNGNSRSSISSYLFGNSRSTSPANKTAAVPTPTATTTNRKSMTSSSSSGNLTTPTKPPANPMDRISEEDLTAPTFLVEEFDPVFNLLDNLSALLCCAFLHVDLIDALFVLSTDAKVNIANKSRNLLVNFLRILSEVLPENACAELLTNPTLIDVAASLGPTRSSNKAHKSSQLLIDLAEAFTIMPYKQTSGSHSSNLSVAGTSAKGRNGSITNKGSGVGSNASSIPLTIASSTKSNFLPLNIRTVFELAEEIKISSLSTTSTGQRRGAESSSVYSSSNSRTLGVLNSLRTSLTPSVDKNDFAKQMDLSRVVGKEGKEPFKWDWVTISDMMEYSFHVPDRLSEALKTKWIRRVSGFYRCSTEEKGYFANLEWEPTNLQYLECACNLYSVLLRDEGGLSFLTSDRRGMLFNEMAQEIELLVTSAASKGWAGTSSSPVPVKNVFRMQSCNSMMARELFTLLGRIVRTPGSRKLLEHTNLFEHLSRLGQFRSLDYITRLVITSLCFSDGGLLSRHLLQLWTTSPTLSPDFRQYLHNVLRVMIQSASSNDSYNWSIEAVVNQLSIEDCPDKILYKAIEEAIHSKSSLRMIIAKRPRLMAEPSAQHMLLRFLSVPEGINYLIEKNWLDAALNQWHASKCKEYVLDVEEKVSSALSKPGIELLPDLLRLIEPIPIRTPEIVREIIARQGLATTNSKCDENGPNMVIPNSDPNATLGVDLQGFMRVPWNIEIKVTNGQQGQYQQSDPVSGNGEYLRVDTFIDISDLSSPLSFDTTSDTNRIIKVRGILQDSKGNPCGQAIAQQKVIANTLLAGICPVNRVGEVQGSLEWLPQRRRTSTTTTHKEEPKNVGRASFVSSGSGSNASAAAIADAASSSDADLPITLGQEYLYDWAICKPGHRQGNVTELEDGLFAVTIPSEPVVWIFSRRATNGAAAPTTRSSRGGSFSRPSIGGGVGVESWFETSRPNRMDASRSGGMLYLVEIHYYFRLETGNGMFVPMPRHIYGELARTLEGCAHLSRRNIIHDLVSKSHSTYDQLTKLPGTLVNTPSQQSLACNAASSGSATLELRSWLWSLGHIGATELGYAAIANIDPAFVEWCIDCACSCPYFNVRGTFFYVLGLLSRTTKGAQRLRQCRWDCSAPNSNCAVAIPRLPKVLFKRITLLHKVDSNHNMGIRKPRLSQGQSRNGQPRVGTMPYLSMSNPPSSIKLLTPFIPSGSVNAELEVLNLIAKVSSHLCPLSVRC